MAEPRRERTGPGTRGSQSWKRRIIAALTERVPFKLASIFFAVMLWLMVSAEEPTTELVAVRFEPVLDDTSMRLTGGVPELRAYVSGRGRDLLRLYSQPPTIHRVVPADVGDSVTFELRPTDLGQIPGVNVRDIQPQTVTLHFAPNAQRTVAVRSELRLLGGDGVRVTGSARIEPESVRIAGPRARVLQIQSVPTVAADLQIGEGQPFLVPLDTTDLGVRVTPTQVRVSIPFVRDSAPVTRIGNSP